MPDTGKWSSDQPGEVTEFTAAEQAEAEAKVERLAKALYERFDESAGYDTRAGVDWDQTAREILEEIE